MIRVSKTRFGLLLIICVVAVAGWRYLKPVPLAQPQINLPPAQPTQTVQLPWPNYGHAAIGAVGYGLLNSSEQARSAPIASIAKIMTALAVLDKKPLVIGQSGPDIAIRQEDVAAYKNEQAQGQSVLPVQNGETLTEYQALQALLIPSANNVAAILANWAFDSTDNYLTYANQKAKILGLNNTTFADASGYSPSTTSSASDLINLGFRAMENPVISSIVGQKQAKLPIAGVQKNVNFLLGQDGVFGIKTGNTDQAGGCILLASKRTFGNQKVIVLTSVIGAPDLVSAMSEAKKLADASSSGFVLSNNTFSSSYSTKWDDQARVGQNNISALIWAGLPAKITANLINLPAGSPRGTYAGTITVKNGDYSKTEKLYLAQEIKKPSFWWRIFR